MVTIRVYLVGELVYEVDLGLLDNGDLWDAVFFDADLFEVVFIYDVLG